jgi:hypothetical protein
LLGLGLLVRLGRQVLAGPVADSGALPVSFYRHLVLEALEEEDFADALHYLRWTQEPLLAQLIVLRLRLLATEHRRRLEAIREQLQSEASAPRRQKYQDLAAEERRALELLREYEDRALAHLGRVRPG